MKYGESSFDILYLIFAITSGIMILRRAEGRKEKFMAYAALILGCGDAFHLVPRVLNYFTEWDLTAALGIGKLITSITMTVFYVLLYYLWLELYSVKRKRKTEMCVLLLALVRSALCLFPHNGWLQNSSDMNWGIIRNIPFVIHGALICYLYYCKRNENSVFKPMWLYILLSFAFYIPVAVAAGAIPLLGMLMLPKTVCYILMILSFLKAQHK